MTFVIVKQFVVILHYEYKKQHFMANHAEMKYLLLGQYPIRRRFCCAHFLKQIEWEGVSTSRDPA
jgi:hypothetical protein